MRALLLNQFFPPDVAPTGQFLDDVARELAARGHDVRVVCSARSYDGGGRWPSRETRGTLTVERVGALGFGRRTFLGKLADYASFSAGLAARLLASARWPDVILSLTTPPYLGAFAKTAALHARCPAVHWVMDVYPDVMAAHGMIRRDSLLWSRLEALARWTFAGAARVLALGPSMADRLRRQADASPVDWVPLWSDAGEAPRAGRALRARRGWAPDDLVLMYSGNMGLGHRFGEFLEASRRTPGVRWAFCGGGKRRAEVEAFARAHGSVELHPYVELGELAESLAAADVHLVSLDAAWQGMMVPSKIQGILAAGRPAIFVGGDDNEIARWIREAGAGWVVPENDADALTAAVDEARDPAERERRGSAAAAFARKHFNRRTNCARIADLLEKAAR